MFDEILNGVLSRVAGARCVLLAGTDGMIVTAVGKSGTATDAIAASLVDLFLRVRLAHEDAGLMPPSEFTSGGVAQHAAVRAVTDQYVLLAVLDGVAGLGRARFELRKVSSEIQPELV